MEFKILEEKDNPVLKRKEIVGSLDYGMGSTPSKAALQKHLSEQLKANIENVEITKILSESGMAKGTAWVKVWQEKKVPLYKTKKAEAPKEEAKPEEKPAEQPKAEEKPKEEAPKEEPKKEQPKEEPKKEEAPAEKGE
jgi:ribosomal protein S24E